MQARTKKSIILILFIVFVILAAHMASISSCDVYNTPRAVDYQRFDLDNQAFNESNVASYKASQSYAPVEDELHLANVVIFIYFNNEIKPDIDAAVLDQFRAQQNSLYSYYQEISYGKINITTYYASSEEGESIIYHAFKAPQARSFYEAIKDGDSRRASVERELVSAAIEDFNEHIDYTDINVDQNNDGYVDSVSFVVSGNYEKTSANWGGLMWPHSLRLTKLGGDTVTMNKKIVDYYTFNFFDSLTVGLLCHEFAHVLGAPDLYHYKYDTSRFQVGYWDLMHFECDTPQYMTTHMRLRYLGSKSVSLSNLYTSKISQITKSGNFTLRAVTQVGVDDDDFLAYKIEINEYESIWIEYRNNNVGTYDSKLPGSGLIVYRVNNKVSGNEDGRYQRNSNPDEVYVYRPNFSVKSDTSQRERENLDYAYLSNNNPKFKSVGKSNATKKYEESTIFLTDGTNTGIRLSINSQTDQEISFSVIVPESLSSANQVEKVEVLDKVKFETLGIKDSHIIVGKKNDMLSVLRNSVKVIITYQDGSSFSAPMDNISFVFDIGVIGVSQMATVRYSDAYNINIVGYFTLTIRDGNLTAQVSSYPNKTIYKLGEELDLTGLRLSITYQSGTTSTEVAYESAPQKFSYIGYDKSQSGEYKVEITYSDDLGNQDTVQISVKVIAVPNGISINQRNSKQIAFFEKGTTQNNIIKGLASYLEVICTQEDGKSFILQSYEYEINLESAWDGLNKKYDITAKLSEDNKLKSAKYSIMIMENTDIIDVKIATLPKLDYGYGQSLNLKDGSIFIETGITTFTVSMEGYYNEFLQNYDCTKAGNQELSANIYGFSVKFTVKVDSDQSKLLTVNANTIFTRENYLRLAKSMTVQDFIKSLASVFTIKVYYNDMHINLNAYKDMLVSDKLSIHLINDDNVVVTKFNIHILGDADSNGIVDQNDIESLAHAILSRQTNSHNYDINQDGVYDIADFALILEQIRNEK